MKYTGLILLFVSISVLSCKSKELQPKHNAVSDETSHIILNETFKKYLPELIRLRSLSLINEKRNSNSTALYATVITTENHVYFHLSDIDCNDQPYYAFDETTDGKSIRFMVNSTSEKPWRLFDLDKTQFVPNKDYFGICHDWYWIAAKFRLTDDKLYLEKISSFYDNSYKNDFFDDEEAEILIQPDDEPDDEIEEPRPKIPIDPSI